MLGRGDGSRMQQVLAKAESTRHISRLSDDINRRRTTPLGRWGGGTRHHHSTSVDGRQTRPGPESGFPASHLAGAPGSPIGCYSLSPPPGQVRWVRLIRALRLWAVVCYSGRPQRYVRVVAGSRPDSHPVGRRMWVVTATRRGRGRGGPRCLCSGASPIDPRAWETTSPSEPGFAVQLG